MNKPKIYIYNGNPYTIKELATISGIPRKTLESRIFNRKLTVDKAIAEGRYEKGKYLFKGHYYTMQQLAELSDIDRHTICARLRRGWTVEDAVTKPKRIIIELENQFSLDIKYGDMPEKDFDKLLL